MKDVIELLSELQTKGEAYVNKQIDQWLQEDAANASLHYEIGGFFDKLGEERTAIPYYMRAIELGLSTLLLEKAYIQLASSYRAIGEYVLAHEVIQKGIKEFPQSAAMQVFYAMVLFNLQEKDKAVEILMKQLVATTSDPLLKNYQRALLFYSDRLNEIW